jgi:hypothetical protein
MRFVCFLLNIHNCTSAGRSRLPHEIVGKHGHGTARRTLVNLSAQGVCMQARRGTRQLGGAVASCIPPISQQATDRVVLRHRAVHARL